MEFVVLFVHLRSLGRGVGRRSCSKGVGGVEAAILIEEVVEGPIIVDRNTQILIEVHHVAVLWNFKTALHNDRLLNGKVLSLKFRT